MKKRCWKRFWAFLLAFILAFMPVSPMSVWKGTTDVSAETIMLLTTDDAYVKSLSVSAIVDGKAPFDATDGQGMDANASNKIVRTYDTLKYTLQYVTASYRSGNAYEQAYIFF